MRLIEARKLVPVFFLQLLFIAKKLYFMPIKVHEMKDLIYLCFLNTGMADVGFYLIHVMDFFLYQCFFIVFLGGFYRDDILSNQELLFTRTKKRSVLFQRGTMKIVLNTCIVYVLLYGTVFSVLCYRTGIWTFDIPYFLYGMFFLVTYILLVNVISMLTDVKLFLVILLTAEILLDNLIHGAVEQGNRFLGVFGYLKNGLAADLPYAVVAVLVLFILLNVIGFKIMETKEVV